MHEGPYAANGDGIFVPPEPVEHRDEEYDPDGFDLLRKMQGRHFWYLGRSRFVLHALKHALPVAGRKGNLKAIDLGGGCGGWIRYLEDCRLSCFSELALADSSVRALTLAGDTIGPDVKRFQIDLLRLRWAERWDVAFLLDVLEHIPQDVNALRQIRESLRPGGLLIVTAPAMKAFWTYNDVLARHVRRYSRADFHRLADDSGFELDYTRYFMTFLSPLLLLSRLMSREPQSLTKQEIRDYVNRTHRVPSWPINQLLRLVFAAETPLGMWLPFPWGTSVLAVLRRGN